MEAAGYVLATLLGGIVVLVCKQLGDVFPAIKPLFDALARRFSNAIAQETVARIAEPKPLSGAKAHRARLDELVETRRIELKAHIDKELAAHRAEYGNDFRAAIGVWRKDLMVFQGWHKISDDKWEGRVHIWLWHKECTCVTNSSDPAILHASKLKDKRRHGNGHTPLEPWWVFHPSRN